MEQTPDDDRAPQAVAFDSPSPSTPFLITPHPQKVEQLGMSELMTAYNFLLRTPAMLDTTISWSQQRQAAYRNLSYLLKANTTRES
jgi:hypothetical protein